MVGNSQVIFEKAESSSLTLVGKFPEIFPRTQDVMFKWLKKLYVPINQMVMCIYSFYRCFVVKS